MRLHKNYSMKRAGEAGSQRRAQGSRHLTSPASSTASPVASKPHWRAEKARSDTITNVIWPGQCVRKEALERPARCLSAHVCIVYVDS